MALFVSACATGPVFQGLEAQPPAGSADPDPSAVRANLGPEALQTNRLLVVGFDGNLFTVDPDGGNRLALTTDAGQNRTYLQPTWSPTGERIAFSRVDRDDSNALVVMAADGTAAMEADLPFPPFYIYWSPDGHRLAYLSNWQASPDGALALRLVEFDEQALNIRTLMQGGPLYFSWAPTSDRLLIHTGNREVALLSLEGERTPLANASGNFAAPQWLPDGQRLFYAVQDGEVQRMILADLNGVEQEAITYFNGAAAFSTSPDGRQAAFIDTVDSAGLNATGPLHLLDLEQGLFRELTPEPTVAFYWSKDGTSLLFLTVARINDRIWLQPRVWNGTEVIELDRFRPTATFFEQYLRFADQYAQSMSFWSPDSRFVVFSGWGENNQAGVWVQPADGSSPARRIARGVYATWSPK